MKAFLLEAPAGLSFLDSACTLAWLLLEGERAEMGAQAEPMDPAGCPGEVGFWIGNS